MIRMILKEAWYRKAQLLLSLLAVVTAVALYVGFFTTGTAARRETIRLMRDLGFNLRIIHADTDLERFWAQGFSDLTLPEDYVQRFATAEGISYNHLLATLQRKVEWRGRTILLTGLASDTISPPEFAGKSPMKQAYRIEPGTALAGHAVASALRLQQGDRIDVMGEPFSVAAVLPEMGSEDDIRLLVHLSDAQRLLGAEGLVNEIRALECLCHRDEELGVLGSLRRQIGDLLPGTTVVQMAGIAQQREEQRKMAEGYFALILPILLVVCAAWIGALAMLNVRDRQGEIGILRALGYTSAQVATLFMGRAALIGLVGAVAGYAIGSWLAVSYGPEVFQQTARAIRPMPALLWQSLVAAPLLAALASFVPTVVAVTQDPAQTLRPE